MDIYELHASLRHKIKDIVGLASALASKLSSPLSVDLEFEAGKTVILNSSTPESTKKFKIKIYDDGVLETEEVV